MTTRRMSQVLLSASEARITGYLTGAEVAGCPSPFPPFAFVWVKALSALTSQEQTDVQNVKDAIDPEIVSRACEVTAESQVATRYLAFAPVGTPVAITSSSAADPTEITTETAHGLSTGDVVTISGHTGSDVDLNGDWVVTVTSTTTFTVPVNVTSGGTGGTVEKKGVSEVSAYVNVTIEGVVRTIWSTAGIIKASEFTAQEQADMSAVATMLAGYLENEEPL